MKLIPVITACAALLCGSTTVAQDFDLSAQRQEIQEYKPVDGFKIDHHGIIINPTPQSVDIDSSKTLDITSGVKVNDRKKRFAEDMKFLTTNDKGIELNIDFGEKAASKASVKHIAGAYTLNITPDNITIVGYDENGAFYGLQTLRQLLDSPASQGGKQLPCMTINDYPTLPIRGVVEGFYGTPWSHQVRLSLIDFFGRFKMNTYVYGPKDDPYHSSPNWRLPYPKQEADQIKELVQACRRNHINFVWAIHPGQDIKWNDEDYSNLLHKFEMMYDLGVRQFAIFFDDISGDGTSPSKQTALLNRLTKEFVNVRDDVEQLILCPTDYNKSWANPTPRGSLPYFGANLDTGIKVFWTGDVVCSDITASTLEWVNSRIKRPALFWWNYPVTDYVRNIVLQGPAYGLDTSLTTDDLSGVLSNPMEHGEASKLALYGVADYAWNVAGYNPIDNWERGLHEMAYGATDAYRTFAIHSCDTETGYRRAESWETTTFNIDNWNKSDAEALKAEFERIEQVPAQMENCNNAQLLAELRPWLIEFGKLGTRGKRAVELIEMFRSGNDDAALWNKYAENIMSSDDRRNYEAHKSGTMKLQPFYDNAMEDIAFRFLGKLSGEVPCNYRGISSFPNSRTTQPMLMLDGDSTTFYTSALPQRAGSWVGIDLKSVREITSVKILQGRNSVNDVDFFDHAALECSTDGTTWTTLIGDLRNQYVIEWNGTAVKARYVRLKRLDSRRTNYVAVRSFEVNSPSISTLGFDLQTDGNTETALMAFDNNATTAFDLDGYLRMGITPGVTKYILLTGLHAKPLSLTFLDKDGNTIQQYSATEPFYIVDVPKGATALKVEGNSPIYEIVSQTSNN